MSPLQMFLPACEPARSEALAMLRKTGRPPRHLVHGIARGGIGRRGMIETVQSQQEQQMGVLPEAAEPRVTEPRQLS